MPPITSPINPITTPITPPKNTPPIKPITPPPVTTAPITQVTTPPPGPPINPLGPITVPPPIVRSTNTESEKDFDKILEETIAEERPQARESIILSPENKQPVKAVEADPVKIEATRKKLNEASAEMAAHPPEEIPNVEEQKSKESKKKRRPKRDVRKAALEAIRAAEESAKQEAKSAQKSAPKPEPKKNPPPKKPEIEPPERRDLKLETTDSAIIKEMLLAGMTTEEISRETGLGRGAIELIQEMTRRQLNRK